MARHKILVISRLFFILVFILVFFIFNIILADYTLAATVNTPTILEIGAGDSTEQGKSFITGLTQTNTEVLVYIDGIFNGRAEIRSTSRDVDNFYYEFDAMLLGGGRKLMLVAQDKSSLVLSPPTAEIELTAPFTTEVRLTKEELITPTPAPTLIAPNERTITAKVKPLIAGLSKSGTKAHIWIDDVYNGQTKTLTHESGTANFAYKPFLNLRVGHHRVWAVAEDEQGRKSRISNILEFKIEEPMPAPTMFEPVISSKTNSDQPFIAGLAKDNSLVRVFIDHKLDGQFAVKNHYSGTASFAYKPFQPLHPGEHLLYTIAFDSRGKESGWSNIIFFTTPRKLTSAKPTITETAAEEMKDTVAEILEPEETEWPLVEVSMEEGTVVKSSPFNKEEKTGAEIKTEEAEDWIEEKMLSEQEEIKGLLEQKAEETKKTGLLDESKERQGRLQLNVVIFIVFLLGVIIWIFWVNRELIKERRAIARLEEENKKKDTPPEETKPDNGEELPSNQPPLI